jgi:hypothetical protein
LPLLQCRSLAASTAQAVTEKKLAERGEVLGTFIFQQGSQDFFTFFLQNDLANILSN